ncbi:hypothetical protein [Intrasporangium sp.]|jgi:hypothetical protein|uniref:hypothetical protein n=1 Tax=Intrasporangium sp. TaxID=1925024 RepID=UPI00336530DC
MLLVPRQLLRSGMTGTVPYYGGRFTPAQAWAAAHPTQPQPGPQAVPPAGFPAPAPGASGARRRIDPNTQAALEHLLEAGVLTDAEYDEMVRRSGG